MRTRISFWIQVFGRVCRGWKNKKDVIVNAYVRIQSVWFFYFLGKWGRKEEILLFKKDEFDKSTHLFRSYEWLGPWMVRA